MTLEMRGIYKSFGANDVLRDISFSVAPGEICALLGENGAGKSTLMNILGGVLPADRGTVLLDGREAAFKSPAESLAAGIAFIHQELNLVNDLSIYENMFIGRELKTRAGLLDAKAMCARCAVVFERMDVDLDPRAMVRDLDASYKQIVEIARALLMEASIIIMDEPTTSLTDPEIDRVFDMMRTLKDQGVAMVFISHKLREVMDICDRYKERHFESVSFSVRAGEVLGFTGLLGDGRSELFQAVFGSGGKYQGQLYLEGKPVTVRDTRQAVELGIGYVPRDRKENGIIKDMDILENGSIVTWPRHAKYGLINWRQVKEAFRRQAETLRIKMGAEEDLIGSLSGGNQQKVVLAKWLNAGPKVLIFDNPTQGVDVGAKEDIYDTILELAGGGVAVIVLSSEAQEIIRLCDRAIVMYHGRVQGELPAGEMAEQEIMRLATGA